MPCSINYCTWFTFWRNSWLKITISVWTDNLQVESNLFMIFTTHTRFHVYKCYAIRTFTRSLSFSVSVSLTKIFSIALYSNKQKHSSCKGHCSRKRNQRTYLCCKSNTTNVVYAATPSFHTLSLSLCIWPPNWPTIS